MKNDVKYVSVLAAIIVAWVGFYKLVEPASAQSMTSPVSVGAIFSQQQAPAEATKIDPQVLRGHIMYYGMGEKAPTNGSVMVSLFHANKPGGVVFLDQSTKTSRVFGPCPKGVRINCVLINGDYTIDYTMVPKPENPQEQWVVGIRGKLDGFEHPYEQTVYVSINDQWSTDLPTIQMYEQGLKVRNFSVDWAGKLLRVSYEVMSIWGDMDFKTDISWFGGSPTVYEVNYPTFTWVDKATYMRWVRIVKYYGAPQDNGQSANNAGLCVSGQFRSTWSSEWVFAQTDKPCTSFAPPPSNGGGNE